MEPVRSLFAVLCVDMEMNAGMDLNLNLYVDIDVRSDRDIVSGVVNTNQTEIDEGIAVDASLVVQW